MKKSIIEIYALSVCFVTVCCFVICLGIGIYDVIEVANPEFTMNPYVFERHHTNEAFTKDIGKKYKGLPDEKIEEKRLQSYDSAIRSERREGFQSMVQLFIIMLIDIVVF